jgi:hypothetical protein
VDVLSSFVCLLVGVALPLAAVFLMVRRGWRQLAVADAYGEVSRRLGLPVDTRGVSLHGHVGDRRIWVGQVMVGHGPDRRMMCWGVLDLERPLGLGVLLRRRGLSERVFRRARSPEVALSDPELERLLEVHADEAHHLREMLTDDVLATLKRMLLRWRDVVVTDRAVRVHLAQPLATTTELQELVDGLFQLAGVLHQARAAVDPPSTLLPWVEQLAPLGRELDLEVEPTWPALVGTIDGHRVDLFPQRSGGGHTFTLRWVDAHDRGMGLLVRPQVAPDGYWSVGQDIQFDDEAFDRAFVVKGYDPDAVRALLHQDARTALVALTDHGTLELDDQRLEVRGLPADVDVLRSTLVRARSLAAALGAPPPSPAEPPGPQP